MRLHLLYPANPLRRSEPDELYAEEHATARDLGFDVSLFQFEEFLDGGFLSRPSLPSGCTVLYRGWMLTPEHYKRLHSEVALLGANLRGGHCSPSRWSSADYRIGRRPGLGSEKMEHQPVTQGSDYVIPQGSIISSRYLNLIYTAT